MDITGKETWHGFSSSWPLNTFEESFGSKQGFESQAPIQPSVHHLGNRPRLGPPSDPFQDPNAQHRASTDSSHTSDPEPDFRECFSPTVYAELVSTLIQESHKEIQAGHYSKAEAAQRKAIEYLVDREAKMHIPFDNKSQMYETLAEIYMKMNRLDQAKGIIGSLLRQEKKESSQKWRLYYMLAEVYFAQDRLPDAEKFAKRAYVGREKTLGKGHALISQAASLLVSIYERQGQTQSAQAFRNLYPTEKTTPLAPQASKHIGKTRVVWNPDLSVDMNATTKSGKTLLINAISSGDDDMVHQALQNGADVDTRCTGSITPLMYAVIHGQILIAGVLLSRGAQIDALTSGWTALHKAVDMSDERMVRLLLDCGANIEAGSPKHFAPNKTITARRESNATDYESEDVDSDDEHGWTALLRAADRGDELMVSLLLDKGADIEARNPSNGTPLSCASENKHIATVDLLLLRGANPITHDEYGWTPLHRAQVNHGGDEVALRLINSGADVNAKCVSGKTPLHHAVERENAPMVLLLLKAGADIGAQDIEKRTPLHTAIECRLEGMVHLLIESGADLTVKDADGRDALAAANHALRKSPEIVKLLGRHVKAMKREGSGSGGGRGRRLSNSQSSVSAGGVAEPDSTSSSWWSRRGKKPK